jgi:hypothetical protein
MAADQRAHHRRNDEVDERVPGLVAPKLSQRGEKQRQQMNRRASQQGDGQRSGRSSHYP